MNLQRKLIDSKAARVFDKAEMHRLNAHMTHSEAVSLKTYQGRSNRDAIDDYMLIQDLIGNRKVTKVRNGKNDLIARSTFVAIITLVTAIILVCTW